MPGDPSQVWQPPWGEHLVTAQGLAHSPRTRGPAPMMVLVMPKCDLSNIFPIQTLTGIKAESQCVYHAAQFVYQSFEIKDKTGSQRTANGISEWITTLEMLITLPSKYRYSINICWIKLDSKTNSSAVIIQAKNYLGLFPRIIKGSTLTFFLYKWESYE